MVHWLAYSAMAYSMVHWPSIQSNGLYGALTYSPMAYSMIRWPSIAYSPMSQYGPLAKKNGCLQYDPPEYGILGGQHYVNAPECDTQSDQ